MKKFFITGTDTDVGKTLVSVALLQLARESNLSTAAVKPVAAGCSQSADGLRNNDALALQSMITAALAYDEINPIALEPAIAPHIAANHIACKLSVKYLADKCEQVFQKNHDFVLVEGAGGWRVPLNATETLADLAALLRIPVVLVVGLKLGCINHALLTLEAIKNDGLIVSGWVACQTDKNMAAAGENIETLVQRLPCPFLGHIPFLNNPSAASASIFLDIKKLLV
ncbi:MAG: dethiobiotin synthetase [Pseudohongiellaceae bacterium]|jgi:dethiobiotin synthetase